MSENEQNKTEEATPFKLKKAREKGQVAKGNDLGFFSTMVALSLFTLMLGKKTVTNLTEAMRDLLSNGVVGAATSESSARAIAEVYYPALTALALLGGTIMLVVIFMEMLQLRGLIFSTHPLKPDFNRINPGQGLKRIFSLKMLKEALKGIVKMTAYSIAAGLVGLYCVNLYDNSIIDARTLIIALIGSGYRLLFAFALLAIFFVVLDQIIARQEFRKQMKMSKSELQRENKDREGEPRQKQKRKRLHAEFIKQTQSLGDLPGSDMLIVNPQHFAVALQYTPGKMLGPKVTTKGRNKFALFLKSEAKRHGIPIIYDPPLARAIFKKHDAGNEVSADHFVALAKLYIKIRRDNASNDQEVGA